MSGVDLVAALDRVGDGFLALDRDWRIRFVNATAERVMRREAAQLIGKNLWEEFPNNLDTPVYTNYLKAWETQESIQFEQYYEQVDAWFFVRIYPSPEGITVVFQDITYLRTLMEERRAYLDRLVEAQDRERAQIAADVHDDSVQALVVVSLRLEILRRKLGPTTAEISSLLDAAHEQVRDAATRLRSLLFDLEPADPTKSLAESIRSQAAHIFFESSIRWSVDDVDGGEELPEAERSQALRITKEALRNAHAHSEATEVVVTIRGDDEGVEVTVADNGPAEDPDIFVSAPGHRGLATMQDRAAVVGGWCTIEPSSPHGCTVRFYLPRIRPAWAPERRRSVS
ncbi:MAG: PAS domain-containing protein [Solirubrobacteraceae bacterium]|nr:PAS domain-containing protein [Solirubrobacteraceae bacterium]